MAYLFYIPGKTPSNLGPVEENAIERIVQAWTAFARTGKPIIDTDIDEPTEVAALETQWTPFTMDNPNYAELGTQYITPGDDITTENIQLWVQIYDEFFRNSASSLQVISLLAVISLTIAHILFNST